MKQKWDHKNNVKFIWNKILYNLCIVYELTFYEII